MERRFEGCGVPIWGITGPGRRATTELELELGSQVRETRWTGNQEVASLESLKPWTISNEAEGIDVMISCAFLVGWTDSSGCQWPSFIARVELRGIG